MSTQPSTDNRKPPANIYSVMLLLSMLFMLIAVIAMYMEWNRWAPDYFRTQSANPQVMLMPADPPTSRLG